MNSKTNFKLLIHNSSKTDLQLNYPVCYKVIDCFPNNKVFYVVVKTIKNTLKMYKLNSLVNIFLEDITKLIIFISSTSIHDKESFFTCLIDGCVFTKKSLFTLHILNYHSNFVLKNSNLVKDIVFFKKNILNQNLKTNFLALNKKNLINFLLTKIKYLNYRFIVISNKVKIIGKGINKCTSPDLYLYLHKNINSLKFNYNEVYLNFKKIFIKNQFDIFLHKNETYISCLKNIYLKNRTEV